jgi:hypothetical protein
MSGSLTSSLTSTNHHREFHARAGAVTVHTTLTAVSSGVDSFLLWGGSTYFCIKFLVFNVVSYL